MKKKEEPKEGRERMEENRDSWKKEQRERGREKEEKGW